MKNTSTYWSEALDFSAKRWWTSMPETEVFWYSLIASHCYIDCKQGKTWNTPSPRSTVPILSYPFWVNKVLGSKQPQHISCRICRKIRMPQVPTDMFINGVMEAIRRNREFVPPYGISAHHHWFITWFIGKQTKQEWDVLACFGMFLPVSSIEQLVPGNNASLYVRPLLFASGQMLGLAPLASEYTFFVTVLPAGGYFGKGSEVGVKAGKDRDWSPCIWFHVFQRV